MKKFLVGLVIVVALLLGAGGLGLGVYNMMNAFNNQAVDSVNQDVETDLTKVAGYKPDSEGGDIAAPLANELRGGNTKLIWETGKTQFGKRHEFDGTWTSLGGAVVYNAEAKTLKAIEVSILIESFNSYGSEHPAPGGLINTVLGKGQAPPTGFDPWFDWATHPNAVFTATEFVQRGEDTEPGHDNHPDGWTHLINGEFDLNGTKQPLSIPAVITFSGEALTIEAGFAISRDAFGIKPKNPLPGTEVDDLVSITTVVKAQPDAGLAIDALAQMLSDQGSKLAAQEQTISTLSKQLSLINETLSSLERKIAKGVGPATPQVDISSLPKTITDQVQYPGKDPLPLEMVLVPGEGEVGPFYMAKHEVTWAMFYDWAYGADIDANQYASLQGKNLRPSPLYEDCNQLKLGLGNRPALSMSRTTAEAFAKWVSERTGRSYRLPTDKEWQTAVKLGGGVPEAKEDLLKQAVFIDNAEIQFDPPFLELTDPVGTKEANALGIHDLLGNAAEWVTDTGTDRIVRGGHFMLEVDQWSADWKATEDQEVWNKTYPQEPKSRFWYRDDYYQGIRLVADVQ